MRKSAANNERSGDLKARRAEMLRRADDLFYLNAKSVENGAVGANI